MKAKYLKKAFAEATRAVNTIDNEEDVYPEHIIEAELTDLLEKYEKQEKYEEEDEDGDQ